MIWWDLGFRFWITRCTPSASFSRVIASRHCAGTWMCRIADVPQWSRALSNFPTCSTANSSSPRYIISCLCSGEKNLVGGKKKKKDFSFILLLKQSYFIIVKYIQVHILSKNHLTNWFKLLKLLGCTSVTYLKAYYSLFTNRSGTESYAVTRVRNVGLNGFKGILHLSGPCVMLFPFESSLLSALCSLSTLWRARGHSLPETEPTWPLCSL